MVKINSVCVPVSVLVFGLLTTVLPIELGRAGSNDELVREGSADGAGECGIC